MTASDKDEGIRQTVPLMAAGLAVSFASLLSTVLVARFLPTVGYGTLAKLLGLFLILSMPGTALMVGVLRRVSVWRVQGRWTQIARWMARVHRLGIAAVVIFALVVWLARSALIHAMNLPGPNGVVEVITAGALWVLVALDRGVLQAGRDYRGLSVNLLVEGVSRTAAMIVLAATMGLEGAALGILFGEVAAFAHVRATVRRALANGSRNHGSPTERVATVAVLPHTRRDLMSDVVVAAASLALLAILQNADVIVLGSRAPGHSGSYAAISVPAKALVFLALVLTNYMLPEAAIRFQQGAAALRQLGYTIAVTSLPAVGLLGLALIAPRWFITFVFGQKYVAGASGLAPLVLAMLFLCVVVALTSYLLGVGSRWVVAVLGSGAAALVTFCILARGRVLSTAHADVAVQGALAFVLIVGFALRHRNVARSHLFALQEAEQGTASVSAG